MTEKYPWYEFTNKENAILQGEIIWDCPILVPTMEILNSDEDEVDIDISKYDVVVMSQSCDIENKKIKLVLVCPIWPYSLFKKKNSYYNGDEGKESLIRGLAPGYHLLNRCNLEETSFEHYVVDFRNVFGVPLDFLRAFISEQEKRICLRPPYREHLSQAFARYFMRVGLPTKIDPLE